MDAPHMDPLRNDLEALRKLVADLTARVYQIERKLAIDAGPGVESLPAQTPPLKSIAPSLPPQAQQPAPAFPVTVPPPRPRPAQPAYARSDVDLESRIGTHWLNRIGIAALLIGIAYFLKFAFDNNWIGPAGRVATGLFAGVAVIAWSERFRSRGYLAFSYSLKAVGIGALYLSLWAAFQVYSLVPGSIAFVAMFVVTAATAGMSWAQDSELLAAFALAGGFSTPVLLSTGQDHEFALFAYVLLLDLWILALVALKSWLRLETMSFLGTILLYFAWYARFYDPTHLGVTILFATLFFAVFAITPLIALQSEKKVIATDSMGSVVAFFNGVAYFVAAYGMIAQIDKSYMAGFALALAGVYIILFLQIDKQVSSLGAPTLPYIHLAIAVGLITVAIPIRLDGHWITIGWFVEAGTLVWVADRIHSSLLNAFALGALGLGVARLLLIDNFFTTQLFFNTRMFTYAVAVAVLGAVAFFNGKRGDEAGKTIAAIAVIAGNLLVLTALGYEIADYYNRQLTSIRLPFSRRSPLLREELRRLAIERDFTYSALWMAYGGLLMAIGFARRSALVRWQALVLIAITIIKVFIYDVSQLDREYRIMSFVVLGALLLAISFLYQGDWLKLSAGSPSL